MSSIAPDLKPAALLAEHLNLFTGQPVKGPVLDLACGDGHNGVFLSAKKLPVVLADVSEENLGKARTLAARAGANPRIWCVDLEEAGVNPFGKARFGAILVFRYLHRPLIPHIRNALEPGGILLYETYSAEQPRFGKPRNPDFLLKPGELLAWFGDWNVVHHFEGIKDNPRRAIAQIVCIKPSDMKPSAP